MSRQHCLLLLFLMFACIGQAATYTVTSTAASGAGSFRAAITASNATPVADVIAFNISGPGPHTIPLNIGNLGTITISSPVLIDGLSQPGASTSNILVELDQSLDMEAFLITTSNVEVRGLYLKNGYKKIFAIDATFDPLQIRNLYFHHNKFDSGRALWVEMYQGSLRKVEISDNTFTGSTNWSGFAYMEITTVTGSQTTIVDSITCARNFGTGYIHDFTGLMLRAGGPGGNDPANFTHIFFLDNRLEPTDTAATIVGMYCEIGGNFAAQGTVSNVVFAGNEIKGNQSTNDHGFSATLVGSGFADLSLMNVTIADNLFDSLFTPVDIVNHGSDGPSAMVSTVTVSNNTMTNSEFSGVHISGEEQFGPLSIDHIDISYNDISSSDQSGINITLSDVNGRSGGSTYLDFLISHNHLHHNGESGLYFANTDSAIKDQLPSIREMEWSQNSIHDNQHVGIGLEPWIFGPTGNCLLPSPTITSVTGTSIPYTVNGTFSGLPNATYDIEFFSNTAPDPLYPGEGESYIGMASVTTNGSGMATFAYPAPGVDLSLYYVTATATHSSNLNTGCFSNALRAGTTQVSQPQESWDLIAYPNPSQDQVVRISPVPDDSHLTLLAVDGRVLYTEYRQDGGAIDLPVGHLPQGIYLLKVEHGEQMASERIVLSR